jgi:UDP-glucose 4-epimerase
MRVLVTGSRGFIGRHVMTALANAGIESLHFDKVDGDDVLQSSQIDRKARACTHVIHLGGMLGTTELFSQAHNAINVNVQGTLNVLTACERYGLSYVGCSMPEVWDNVYQATKQCARSLASAWHRHKGVPVCHVRAFNVYGEGQRLCPAQKIIPTFAWRGWRGESLPVWGDGTQLVDLVWVGDVAEMLVRALNFGANEVFDAGTGYGQSVVEVANNVITMTGMRSQIQYLPMRAGEDEGNVVASGEGWNLIGFRPVQRSQQLRRTVHSYAPELASSRLRR